MNEAAMAKALDGCFFWERTTYYDPNLSKESADIRAAQRKYASKAKPNKYEPPNGWWNNSVPVDLMDRINALKRGVAIAFGVSVTDIESRSTNRKAATPKAFYMWALCRYFPETSMNQMSKMIDRHYSTIIHGRDTFKLDEHIYTDTIEKMDKYMGHKSG
jgi:hypothetical protein